MPITGRTGKRDSGLFPGVEVKYVEVPEVSTTEVGSILPQGNSPHQGVGLERRNAYQEPDEYEVGINQGIGVTSDDNDWRELPGFD